MADDAGQLVGWSVAPRGGAGIEINTGIMYLNTILVAPRGGAGIEIFKSVRCKQSVQVAPRGGAGIEIWTKVQCQGWLDGRPSRRGGN